MNYFQQESLAFIWCRLLCSFLQPSLRSIVLVSLVCFLAWGLKGIYNLVCLFKEVWYFFSTVKLFRISRVQRKGR